MDTLFKKQEDLQMSALRISPEFFTLSYSYQGLKNLKLLLQTVHSVIIFLLGRLAQQNRCTPALHSAAK
jgi:hypothetical protein